jgi:hypothetical protein
MRVGMPATPWAALVAVIAVGCSGAEQSSWPTAPSPIVSSSAAGPLRIERWSLTLKIREVLGTDCDAPLDATRRVDLRVEFADNGTVAMRYSQSQPDFADAAAVRGWTLEQSFEGSGLAYEGLPCSGAALEPSGAPTTLTGYFSDDGRMFSGVEVRRYMGRPQGEIVYHLEWEALKVDS